MVLSSLLAMMACAPVGGAVRVTTASPAPSPEVAASAAAPTLRVSTGPRATPAVSIAPSSTPEPAKSPETPEETATLEPSAAPSAKPITVTYTDQSAWAEKLHGDFPAWGVADLGQVALNREGQVPVADAIGFNVPDKHHPTGFRWNEGDRTVDEWYPQGVGGFTRDGRRWLVVSWYAKDAQEDPTKPEDALSYRGARLSLIDVTDPKHVSYRHVLLAQDAANIGEKGLFRMGATARAAYKQGDRYAPVPVHAGGVEVYGHWLYLVDTALGVRQFDLDRLFRAEGDPAKSSCGLVDGKAYAFDYRYVLPQTGYYRIVGAAPYSCLSFDAASMTMWLGQYLAPDDAARSAVTGIPLGADGRLGAQATTMAFPKDAGGGYAHRIQGVFRRGGQTWMSMTGQTRYEGSTARLALYEDGASTGYRWRWPHGAEDLYYDADRDMLWCLTEFPGSLLLQRDRCVFGVTLGTYQAP